MITITGLRFGYRSTETLFDDLSLDLKPGNIYGLLGRNGAGKTSLLRIISGQLYAQGGTCSVADQDPRLRSPALLREIYFLPEEFYLPAATPAQYVGMYASFYPRFDRGRFDAYLKEFELPPNKKVSTYSYGQKKKLLLAFALASGCSLLLLDEPTNGLDIPSKGQFRRLVAAAMTDRQTFVISTHQVRDMESLIDPLIVVHEGKIVFNHSMEAVTRKLVARVQQEQPDQQAVLYSEKVLGGWSVVAPNTANEDSAIDLELLFNAVVADDRKVRSVFEQGGAA